MATRWTRRAVLSGCAGFVLPAGGAAAKHFPTEAVAYSDPSTEFSVVRLTDPVCASYLPALRARAFGRKGDFLVYCSLRTGRPQAFRMDLKTGESDQLTEVEALDGSSINLLANERGVCYFDGPSLRRTDFSNLRGREIHRLPQGWARGNGFCVSRDGRQAALVETRGKLSRLRLVKVPGGGAATLVEKELPLSDPVPGPRRAGVFYRQGRDTLWLASEDGRHDRPLDLASGRIGAAHWSPDGSSILYLSIPDKSKVLNSIREHLPETGADRLVAATSQFAVFSPNSAAAVFVGASANKASPHVLLLLRATSRELTLCEHRASDPAGVAPVFSPDSQRIYFQSDRHGKPAIYRMRVDTLVEKTET